MFSLISVSFFRWAAWIQLSESVLSESQFRESGCLLLWLLGPVGSQSDMPCRQGCNNLNLNWLAEDVLAVKSRSAQCELFIPVTLLKCYRPLAEHYLV